MNKEIERKFLVTGEYKQYANRKLHIVQGYLSSVPERTVRVRIFGDKGFITVKGATDPSGTTRLEWEKEITLKEAEDLLKLCEPGIIDKTRYFIPAGKHTIETDEFHGEHEGLVIAEIELNDPRDHFEKPEWLGQEVTGVKKYYNSMLRKKE